MNQAQKMLSLSGEGRGRKIFVTHVTIRQSISVLVLRLIFLELLASITIILFYSILGPTNIIRTIFGDNYGIYNILLFIVFTLGKTFIMTYVVIEWLNEYYEITSREVIHRRGLLFRKEERHNLDHIASIKIDQGALGRLLNFGSLTLFNWALDKYTTLYLIHNPVKYLHILESILYGADREKEALAGNIIEEEKD